MQDLLFTLHAAVEDRHWWFCARRSIVSRLVRRLLPTGSLIVDAGCGTGGMLSALSPDYRCIGIDPTPEAIRLARERPGEIDFRCGKAPEDIADEMRSVDLALMLDVLEHVEDDAALLARLLAALRPGALLLLTVPADMRLWSQADVSYAHFRRYDRAGFARLWSDLPVETVMLSHFNSRLYFPVRAVRALNRLRGSSSGPAGTDLSMPPAPLNRALQSLFAGEGRVLEGLLENPRGRGYRRGVSLIAVLRRRPEGHSPTGAS